MLDKQLIGVCHASEGGGDSVKDPLQGRALIYGRPLATEGPRIVYIGL